MNENTKKLPAVISDAFDRSSAWYAENEMVRNYITSIKVIGIPLDSIFAKRGKNIIERRTKRLFDIIDEKLSDLDDDKIDKKYLESEEFYDLIRETIESSAKTSSDDKIYYYVKILRGAVKIHNRDEYSPEEYLGILTYLAPREIEVAKIIYHLKNTPLSKDDGKKDGKITELTDRIAPLCNSIPKDDIPFILCRLQSAGLIHEITGAFLGYGGGAYEITDTFHKLMRFIEEEKDFIVRQN